MCVCIYINIYIHTRTEASLKVAGKKGGVRGQERERKGGTEERGGEGARKCGVIERDPALYSGSLSSLCGVISIPHVLESRLFFSPFVCLSVIESMRHIFPAWRSTIILNHLSSLAARVGKLGIGKMCYIIRDRSKTPAMRFGIHNR